MPNQIHNQELEKNKEKQLAQQIILTMTEFGIKKKLNKGEMVGALGLAVGHLIWSIGHAPDFTGFEVGQEMLGLIKEKAMEVITKGGMTNV